MSRHTSRKSRWAQVSAREYRAAFGVVRYRAGAWEGELCYERRPPASADEPAPAWRNETAAVAGRFKRPRNAMMAVEDRARELLRRHGAQIRIAFEDRAAHRSLDPGEEK
jgi:hypothetical protein